MVFLGDLAGSNAVTTDTLTTSGLVSISTGITVGLNNTHQAQMNTFQFGSVSVTGVTNTASKLVTVPYNQTTTGTMFAMATPFYSGTASPLPSLYVWIDNLSSTTATFAIIADDDTPGTYNCQIHYWIFN
jgi:hypothetical protein